MILTTMGLNGFRATEQTEKAPGEGRLEDMPWIVDLLLQELPFATEVVPTLRMIDSA